MPGRKKIEWIIAAAVLVTGGEGCLRNKAALKRPLSATISRVDRPAPTMLTRESVNLAAASSAEKKTGQTIAAGPEPFRFLPHALVPASRRIATIDADGLKDRGPLLAVVSLQGLVNRIEPRIFVRQKQTSWLLDEYKAQGYVTSEHVYTDPFKLIGDFKDEAVSGAVVTDPARPFTINLATNIAGVENRIIITPQMIPQIAALGISDIMDLRSLTFADDADAYRWVYDTYYPRQRHDLLGVAYYARYNDFRRDYLIAFQVPTFWLPGASDPDYSLSMNEHVNHILAQAPPNIPILGWWQGTDSARGKKRGVSEDAGVKLAGSYGKFLIGDDFAANYTFHSGIVIDPALMHQKKPADRPVLAYDPHKKYVALTMLDSGHATWFWQRSFPERWWTQQQRGEVALNYGIAPALYDLVPGLVAYLYRTATPQDYFFGALSGLGYCYPFEKYGENVFLTQSATSGQTEVLADYLIKSARALKAMDLEALALYTHPWQAWEHSDQDLLDNIITPNLANIRILLAGMGRDEGFDAGNSSSILRHGLTLHRTLTRWPPPTLIDATSHADLHKDGMAVRWLAREIRTQGEKGQFIQAMALSWVYGPRRLKMLSDMLTTEGYLFVTLDTFDALFRASQQEAP